LAKLLLPNNLLLLLGVREGRGMLPSAQYDVTTPKYAIEQRKVMSGTKVYLAGPDVFYPDALARGHQMHVICAAYGFLGVYPLDSPIDATLPMHQRQFSKQIVN
jgi:hypothetical protein